MATIGKSGRNSLIIGLQSNYDEKAETRSVSPVMTLSMKEEYELKDCSGSKLGKVEDESQSDSETELTEQKLPETKERNIRHVSEASNESKAFDVSTGNTTEKGISTPSKKSARGKTPQVNRTKSRSNSSEITDFDLTEEPGESRMSHESLESTELSVFAGSRSSSGKSLTTHTSFYNDVNDELRKVAEEMDDVLLDYFCVDHMQLCSMKAIHDNHGDCKNVVPAIEWAEEQQYEKERKTTESQLQKFDAFAGIMIDERKNLKRYLTERKEDITEEVLEVMEDLVTCLLKKQKEFTDKFEALHESKIKIISDQIKRCSMVQKETSTCMKQLAVS